MYSKIAVVGVGNILMRDDGLGVHLVKEMVKYSLLPKSVRCIDGGTTSFEALYACGNCNHIIVVDAVKAGGKPGTIYKMNIEKWRGLQGISLHHTCLLYICPGCSGGFNPGLILSVWNPGTYPRVSSFLILSEKDLRTSLSVCLMK